MTQQKHLLDPAVQAKIVETLHTRIWDKRNLRFGWQPHAGQVKAGMALFRDKKHRIFLQCGRKWGKTEFVLYTLTRWAALNPDSTCSYFAPTRKDAKSIVWDRLKRFIPKEFLLDGNPERAFKEQELVVRLWNGSKITVDGTDNENSGRGIEPHVVVYDEYKDFKKGFHESMEPNLEVYDAPIIFIGTPPDHENQFTEMAETVKADPDGFYLELPSREGPVYGSERGMRKLEKIKQECAMRGDLAYFIREYEGRFVLGGAGAVFPMWDRKHHVRPDEDIREELRKDMGKLQWLSFNDPGSTSVFANLTVAFNPFSKRLYLLGELYESDPMETTTRRIWPRIEALALKWYPNSNFLSDDWRRGYDEAAVWFALEVADGFGAGLEPTNKKLAEKENGLSLIKDQLLEYKLIVAESCEKFIWEVERYVKDKNGKISTKHDHLIDCLRYINYAIGYRFDPEDAAPDRFKEAGFRAVRLADEFDVEEMFGDGPVDDDFG